MRGFFAPEAVYFNALTWFTGTADLVAQHSIDHLIQGKSITLFACLFGVGFAAQISRAVDQGRSIRFYPRRVLILLAIRDRWKSRLAPFGAVGRMALTNCLTQSLILANFFWLAGSTGASVPLWA
jgi:uncharacterized membrane protein YeiB